MSTKIEWTDETWNPVRGCSIVSEGCKNCYAMRQAHRFSGKGRPYEGLTRKTAHGPKWTGKLKFSFTELQKPLKWKKPRRIFVCSMSDLFHEGVHFNTIAEVFIKIEQCPQHTFQILTKRPERAVQFFEWLSETVTWKPKTDNVWIGTSVEDQKTANERIPHLLKIPAAVRFLSCEPLLGPVDLKSQISNLKSIHWVIAGGESGPGARPMHPDWVRSLRDQCKDAAVPFFFKQWGEYMPFEADIQPPFYNSAYHGNEMYDAHGMNFIDPETGNAGKFKGFRWFDHDTAAIMDIETNCGNCTAYLKMGKARTGCMLDGKVHREFPREKCLRRGAQ
jgi:protein gp37